MKALVLACLLVVVYASNPEKVKRFHESIAKCVEELNKQPTEIETAYCAINKLGLIDEQNKYILDKGIALVDDIVSDEAKIKEGKEIIHKCYEQLSYQADPETNKKLTMNGIQCGASVLTFIDKL